MIKHSTLLCLILSLFYLPLTIKAQNFQTVYPFSQSHFIHSIPFQNNREEITTINIDSVAPVTNGNQFYNKLSLDISNGSQMYFANRWSFAAKDIFILSSGIEHYTNLNNDTILIQSQSPVNTTWTFYTYPNGDYIEAKIISLVSSVILGITDDIKTIELNAKNSGGVSVNNLFNGKQLKLSKQYGWVEMLAFRNFPDDTTAYYLTGLSNPAVGIQNLTADSIFNFNVGDEFHRRNMYSSGIPTYSLGYSIEKILSKSFSSGGDSVFYQIEKCSRGESYNFGVLTISTFHDTLDFGYDISLMSQLNMFSEELFFSPNSGFYKGYLNFYSDTNFMNRLKKSTHNYFYFDTICHCYMEVIGTGVYPNLTYASGLGLVDYYDNSCFGMGCEEHLVYYKKGTEEWGTPYNCATLLSTKELSLWKSKVKFFPNPANESISVELPDVYLTDDLEIKFYDLRGKLCLHQPVLKANNAKVNLHSLTDGIYFAELYNNDGIIGREKVVLSNR